MKCSLFDLRREKKKEQNRFFFSRSLSLLFSFLFQSFYIDKYSKSQVEMIKDSNDVNRASLDLANKVK